MTNGTQNLDNRESGQITIGACYKQPFSFFNSDNMEIMKQFEDKHFDLACIDPEYGIGMDGGETSAIKAIITLKKKNGTNNAQMNNFSKK
jgi:DNA modification methylase